MVSEAYEPSRKKKKVIYLPGIIIQEPFESRMLVDLPWLVGYVYSQYSKYWRNREVKEYLEIELTFIYGPYTCTGEVERYINRLINKRLETLKREAQRKKVVYDVKYRDIFLKIPAVKGGDIWIHGRYTIISLMMRREYPYHPKRKEKTIRKMGTLMGLMLEKAIEIGEVIKEKAIEYWDYVKRKGDIKRVEIIVNNIIRRLEEVLKDIQKRRKRETKLYYLGVL